MAKKGQQPMVAGPDNWQAKNDASTLMQAQEIMADKKRYAKAQTELARQQKEIARAIQAGPKPSLGKALMEKGKE